MLGKGLLIALSVAGLLIAGCESAKKELLQKKRRCTG